MSARRELTVPIDHLFDIRTLRFLRGVGVILKHQISAFSYRRKTLKNHIFLLNQANGLVFGRRVLIHKSYNLRCILCFFCEKITFYIVLFAIVLNYFEKTYMEFNGKMLGAFHLEKKFGSFGGNKNGFSDR